jgi:hypothetical protein
VPGVAWATVAVLAVGAVTEVFARTTTSAG